MSSVRALGLALLPMGALAAAGASSSVLLVVAAGLAALALLAGVAFLFSVCIQRRELETSARDFVESARPFLGSQSPAEVSAGIAMLKSALRRAPWLAVSIREPLVRALMRLQRYEEVVDVLRDVLPDLSSPLLIAVQAQENRHLDMWQCLMLGQATYHLGWLDHALVLLRKAKHLSLAAHRREASSLEDDFFRDAELAASPLETLNRLILIVRFLLWRQSAGDAAYSAGLFNEAVRHYSKVLDSKKGIPQALASTLFLRRAIAFRAAGQIADAIADCSRSYALELYRTDALWCRAMLYYSAGCFQEAADDLRLLLSLLEMIGQQERTEDKPDLSMVLPMALRDRFCAECFATTWDPQALPQGSAAARKLAATWSSSQAALPPYSAIGASTDVHCPWCRRPVAAGPAKSSGVVARLGGWFLSGLERLVGLQLSMLLRGWASKAWGSACRSWEERRMLHEIAGGQERREEGSPKQGAHVSPLSIEERYRLWRQMDLVQKMLDLADRMETEGRGGELSDQGDMANGSAGEQRIGEHHVDIRRLLGVSTAGPSGVKGALVPSTKVEQELQLPMAAYRIAAMRHSEIRGQQFLGKCAIRGDRSVEDMRAEFESEWKRLNRVLEDACAAMDAEDEDDLALDAVAEASLREEEEEEEEDEQGKAADALHPSASRPSISREGRPKGRRFPRPGKSKSMALSSRRRSKPRQAGRGKGPVGLEGIKFGGREGDWWRTLGVQVGAHEKRKEKEKVRRRDEGIGPDLPFYPTRRRRAAMDEGWDGMPDMEGDPLFPPMSPRTIRAFQEEKWVEEDVLMGGLRLDNIDFGVVGDVVGDVFGGLGSLMGIRRKKGDTNLVRDKSEKVKDRKKVSLTTPLRRRKGVEAGEDEEEDEESRMEAVVRSAQAKEEKERQREERKEMQREKKAAKKREKEERSREKRAKKGQIGGRRKGRSLEPNSLPDVPSPFPPPPFPRVPDQRLDGRESDSESDSPYDDPYALPAGASSRLLPPWHAGAGTDSESGNDSDVSSGQEPRGLVWGVGPEQGFGEAGLVELSREPSLTYGIAPAPPASDKGSENGAAESSGLGSEAQQDDLWAGPSGRQQQLHGGASKAHEATEDQLGPGLSWGAHDSLSPSDLAGEGSKSGGLPEGGPHQAHTGDHTPGKVTELGPLRGGEGGSQSDATWAAHDQGSAALGRPISSGMRQRRPAQVEAFPAGQAGQSSQPVPSGAAGRRPLSAQSTKGRAQLGGSMQRTEEERSGPIESGQWRVQGGEGEKGGRGWGLPPNGNQEKEKKRLGIGGAGSPGRRKSGSGHSMPLAGQRGGLAAAQAKPRNAREESEGKDTLPELFSDGGRRDGMGGTEEGPQEGAASQGDSGSAEQSVKRSSSANKFDGEKERAPALQWGAASKSVNMGRAPFAASSRAMAEAVGAASPLRRGVVGGVSMVGRAVGNVGTALMRQDVDSKSGMSASDDVKGVAASHKRDRAEGRPKEGGQRSSDTGALGWEGRGRVETTELGATISEPEALQADRPASRNGLRKLLDKLQQQDSPSQLQQLAQLAEDERPLGEKLRQQLQHQQQLQPHAHARLSQPERALLQQQPAPRLSQPERVAQQQAPIGAGEGAGAPRPRPGQALRQQEAEAQASRDKSPEGLSLRELSSGGRDSLGSSRSEGSSADDLSFRSADISSGPDMSFRSATEVLSYDSEPGSGSFGATAPLPDAKGSARSREGRLSREPSESRDTGSEQGGRGSGDSLEAQHLTDTPQSSRGSTQALPPRSASLNDGEARAASGRRVSPGGIEGLRWAAHMTAGVGPGNAELRSTSPSIPAAPGTSPPYPSLQAAAGLDGAVSSSSVSFETEEEGPEGEPSGPTGSVGSDPGKGSGGHHNGSSGGKKPVAAAVLGGLKKGLRTGSQIGRKIGAMTISPQRALVTALGKESDGASGQARSGPSHLKPVHAVSHSASGAAVGQPIAMDGQSGFSSDVDLGIPLRKKEERPI